MGFHSRNVSNLTRLSGVGISSFIPFLSYLLYIIISYYIISYHSHQMIPWEVGHPQDPFQERYFLVEEERMALLFVVTLERVRGK